MLRRSSRLWVAVVASVAAVFPLILSADSNHSAPQVDVLFSPKGGCQDRIVAELSKAKQSIRVQAYSFTNAVIAKAILDAKKRGVDCEVILDKSQRTDKYSSATFFYNQGIPTLIDSKHAIAHNKVIIIDESTVITGSYNFSQAAEESNAENLLVLSGMPEIARKYVENYASHKAHAEPYLGPGAAERERPEAARAPPAAEDTNLSGSKTDAADPTVYVTRTGSKYHQAGCSYLKSSSPMPLSQAKGRYGPCSRCDPPK